MSKPVTAIFSLVYGLMLAPVTLEAVLHERIASALPPAIHPLARSGSLARKE